MYNEELCNLIWKRYNEQPSPHLYAMWVAYKECADFVGLYLFRGSEKITNIVDDMFWNTYYDAYNYYTYYNNKISEIVKNRK